MHRTIRSICLFACVALAAAGIARIAAAETVATVSSAAAARAQVVAMFAAAATKFNASGISEADRDAVAQNLADGLAVFAMANPQFADDIAQAVTSQPNTQLRVAVLNSLPEAFRTASTSGSSQPQNSGGMLPFLSSLSASVQTGATTGGGGRSVIVVSPN